MIAATPLALAALPAAARAAGADAAADPLYAEALDAISDELGILHAAHELEPDRWMRHWCTFLANVADRREEAIARHGEAARPSWERATDVLLRSLEAGVAEDKARRAADGA